MQEHDNEVYNADSNIAFEKDHLSLHSSGRKIPRLLRWIIFYSGGLVKNEKQASNVALVFSFLVIIISLLLVFGGSVTRQDYGPLPVTGHEFIEVDWPPSSQ
jgi:hypothetical protein